MTKRKVVHIVEAMLGGVRRHVCDIIENLNPEQFELYLIYSENRADATFFKEKETLCRRATLIVCNAMERELSLKDYRAYREIVDHLKKIKPDIVHCHSAKAGFVGRLAGRRCSVPKIIYTPHAYAFQNPELSIAKRKLYVVAERYLARYATTVTINVSKGEREAALRNRIDTEDKLHLIYNGIPDIELPDKKELRRRLGLKDDIYYVGTTSRCTPQKDPFAFLEVAESVIAQRDDVSFIYIGDGELLEDMKQWVAERNLGDRILLPGFREDSGEVVGAFDVYLSTALYEGMPYSLLEATRAGVPIVATDVEGNNEIVETIKGGILVKAGRINQMDYHIQTVLNSISSYSKRDEIMVDEVYRSSFFLHEIEMILTDS